MQWIDNVTDLSGKRVLLRADYNAPVVDGQVVDAFRVTVLLPTLLFLRDAGAKVIILSHFGRDALSIEPIYRELRKHVPISFVEDIVGDVARSAVERLEDGEILLLENVRRDPREVDNNDDFARELASLADVYVNDAFAASHREHASIIGVPRYLPHYGGLRLREEIEALTHSLQPEDASIFILGGIKFETKFPLIEKFSRIYDEVFVCGALANNFFRAQGFEIGDSLISGADVDMSGLGSLPNVSLPIDVVVSDSGKNQIRRLDEIEKGERILDAGPATAELLRDKIAQARFVLWNGPLGEYEHGFTEGTDALTHAIVESDARCVIGGGDTVAAVSQLGLRDKFSFVSTGGGAMLEFLLHGTLPGIEALEDGH
ncbi:MAG: phosphoglycerate kinase [Candidatus Pacebacteria bacterium]|nr:phosphoglycerate kinase [Candidatus Paceibacterota bacterium]